MSTFRGEGALLLWIDVAPEADRETDGWYIDEHLPERVDIGGYHRARRYAAIEGAPQYLSLFEAQTPAALASAGYLSLVGKISEQSQRIRAAFSNVVRNTFKVRVSQGRGVGAVIGSLRLAPSSGSDAGALPQALAALDDCALQCLQQHAVVGTHWLEAAPEVRAQMDGVRATGTNDARTDYVLLVEASRAADLAALRAGLLDDQALAALGWRVEAWGIYGLLYEVSDFSPAPEKKLEMRPC